ncbi:MAG: hypothetical protein OEV66_03515 [Spirochaetia bacterium]|nr:hypothetical protein [Spirochaetia bacterium]
MLVPFHRGLDWDLDNETGKAGVRWFLILLVAIYLGHLLDQDIHSSAVAGTLNHYYVWGLIGFYSILNLGFHIYLHEKRKLSRGISGQVKYFSMTLDLAMVTALLFPTGGRSSMFYLLYFVVILSNGIRYGMKLSLIGLIIFNCLYVFLLFYQFYPNLNIPDFQTEVLKVIGAWFVGIYTGYLSARFEILHKEVEKYRQIIAQMVSDRKND